MHYACSEGHIEIVDILIDANTDPNLPYKVPKESLGFASIPYLPSLFSM
jgi:hypothetical protein